MVSKIISLKKQPYFIAEIGVNFENDLKKSKKNHKTCKRGWCRCSQVFNHIKLEKIACKKSPYYWDLKEVPIKSQYELFKKFDKFGYKEFKLLKNYCDKLKIDFLSTPFDLDAVDYLDELVPFFKIASADLNNVPLIEKIIKKKKPIVLSTGACKISEIEKAVNFIKSKNKNKSNYSSLCFKLSN